MTNYTVPPTYYPQHKPNTYRAYATIGGSVVNFLGDDGQLRGVDGGKLYPSHKNAQARARQLNDPIKHAMKKAAKKYDYPAIEAYFDGYTAVIRVVEDNDLKKVFNLNVRKDEMPPHYSEDFDTLEEVKAEIKCNSHFLTSLIWTVLKEEEN